MLDPHEELEVSRNATDEVIQAAYRRLARKFHPDSGESPDANRMIRLNQAYDIVRTGRRPPNNAVAQDPVEALINQAEAAADSSNWEIVDRLARQVLNLERNNLRALLLLLEIEVTFGRWISAESLADGSSPGTWCNSWSSARRF